MQVEHEAARQSFTAQLDTFVGVLDQLGEDDFWAASRCRGWCVADVVVHVHLGLQEMLLGIVSPTSAPADTDAASYWAGSPAGDQDADAQLHHLHFVRLLTAAHRRPASLLAQLQMTRAGLDRGIGAMAPGRVDFQHRVLSSGDFLATWAVELAVHHLDLGRELSLEPPRASALALARATIDSLAGGFPTTWSDERVVLLGTGRVRPQEQDRVDLGDLVDRLPVLG